MGGESFFFIKYSMEGMDRASTQHQCVSEKHPFAWLAHKRSLLRSTMVSLNDWKEISKEDFLEGKKVIGIG